MPKHPRLPDFGKVFPEASNWENWRDHAYSERMVMVAEFHAWLVRTRIELEQAHLTTENARRGMAPFAQAGMDNAPTPQEVPMCVLQFALACLQTLEFERKLKLLNTYYRQAANMESDTNLNIEEGNEAEVNELWEWFIEERNEKEKS